VGSGMIQTHLYRTSGSSSIGAILRSETGSPSVPTVQWLPCTDRDFHRQFLIEESLLLLPFVHQNADHLGIAWFTSRPLLSDPFLKFLKSVGIVAIESDSDRHFTPPRRYASQRRQRGRTPGRSSLPTESASSPPSRRCKSTRSP